MAFGVIWCCRTAINSSLFKQWLKNLQTETGILANNAMSLKRVLLQVAILNYMSVCFFYVCKYSHEFWLKWHFHPSTRNGWRVKLWIRNPLGVYVTYQLKKKKKKACIYSNLQYILVLVLLNNHPGICYIFWCFQYVTKIYDIFWCFLVGFRE